MRRPIGIRDSEARIVASGDDEAVIIVRDITQRKYQEAQLEAERDFIRTVVDNAPALFVVLDGVGSVLRFNDALAALRGIEDGETVRGRPFWDVFITDQDAEAVHARFEEAVGLEGSPRHEHRWRTADGGEPAFVEWSATRLPDQDGQARHLVSGLDVTARRRQDQELRRLYAELESRNRELQRERDFANTIADTTPSLLCVVTAEGRVVPHGVNPAFEDALGWIEDEVTGRTFDELVLDAEDRKRFRAVLEWVRAGGAGGEMESGWRTRNGETLAIAWTLTPLQDRREQQWYLISGSDVTERKRQEEELRRLYEELEERNRMAERERDFLNAIANNAPSMLVLIDETGVVAPQASNRAFEETLQVSPIDAGGRKFWEAYVAPGEADEVRERIERVVAGEPMGEHDSTWVRSDGTRLLVAWSCTPLPQIDERTLFLITGVDVTARKGAEEEVRASRQRIVEAGDAERRRLERNLHDGAQQRLVAISISLRLAKAKLRDDPVAAGPLLEAAAEELAHALEELRELARGIHPAVLTDRGLHPALIAVASRSPIPVALDVTEDRMPGPVEAAAYYVVSEALANVAKYAGASTVSVRVARLNGRAVVEVADDGVGGADPTGGTGLRGLADRVSALDGHLDVVSPPQRGTRIRAEIPLA
jgi:PAS domain S-box-containing protein